MLDKTLAPPAGRAYILFRFVVGFLFAMHGVQKVFGYLADGPKEIFTQKFHWKFEMGEAAWPIVNKGELALVYAFAFLYIACRGSGYGGGKKKAE